MSITPMRLPAGQHVRFGGKVHLFLRNVPGGQKVFKEVDSGIETAIDDQEVAALWEDGQLSLVPDPSLPEPRRAILQRSFDGLPDDERAKAFMRREYALALLDNRELGNPKPASQVIAEVHARRAAAAPDQEEPLWHPSTVYRWAGIAETPEGRTALGFVFSECARGNRKARRDAEDECLITDVIAELYPTPQRRRVKAVHDRIVALLRSKGKNPPCRRTIRRRIKKLSPYDVMVKRHGRRAADQKYKRSGVAPVADMPADVYELDAHLTDVVLIEEETGFILGRAWITVAIDRCTRMVVGFHISLEPPSTMTLGTCLRNAIERKGYVRKRFPDVMNDWISWGLPTGVVADNTFENRSNFLKEAALAVGFRVEFARVNTPEEKAKVERFFGTLTRQLIQQLPGTTFSSPKERGDYDPEAAAVVTFAKLDEYVHQWVVDVYNREHHRGINDVPERLWKERMGQRGVAPVRHIDDLRMLSCGIVERVPRHYGVQFMGLLYNGEAVQMLRTRPGAGDLQAVKVRFDPNDLDFVEVLDPKAGVWLRVPSCQPEYTPGMNLARHRVILRDAIERKQRGYVTVWDLCEARDRLARKIENDVKDARARGRKRIAVLEGRMARGSWGDRYRLAVDAYTQGPACEVVEDEIPVAWPGRLPKAEARVAGAANDVANVSEAVTTGSQPAADEQQQASEEDYDARASREGIRRVRSGRG